MQSSDAVVSPPPIQASTVGGEGGLEETKCEHEYEEIEEEIEVEEEVEEEVEGQSVEKGDDSEIGEDLTPVRQENYLNESVSPPSFDVARQDTVDVLLMPESKDEMKNEEFYIDGEKTSRDSKKRILSSDKMWAHDKNSGPFIVDCNAQLADPAASRQNNNDAKSFAAEIIQTSAEAVEHLKQISPRMRFPLARPRDSTYIAEFYGDNKRRKIICEFHAKGWCIKGKSCRFLHIKKGIDSAEPKTDLFDAEAITASSIGHILPSRSRNILSNALIEKSVFHKHDLVDGALEHTDETIGKKNDLIHNDHRSNLSYYPRPPMVLGSSSRKTDSLGAWNVLETNREYHTSASSSLRQSTSLSGSNSGILSGSKIKNTQPAKYEMVVDHNDWEPSVPFCPSHVITQNLLLKERFYDPIRDSLEQTVTKDGLFECSNSARGISTKNAHLQLRDLQEEKALNTVHVENTSKSNRSGFSCDSVLKSDEPKHQVEMLTDGSGQKVENNFDVKRDVHVQNESRIQKYFHAALVEFVKDLVKPTWREGLMSKDAHKMIVKKAVDKVLLSFQPRQIPNTAESIKSYLSSSQIKLSKLVEGYIEKYGKS